MTNRSTWYAHQCLAASGLAVMDSRIAWQLRPDLWSPSAAEPRDSPL